VTSAALNAFYAALRALSAVGECGIGEGTAVGSNELIAQAVCSPDDPIQGV
jgi:hypothetical protein